MSLNNISNNGSFGSQLPHRAWTRRDFIKTGAVGICGLGVGCWGGNAAIKAQIPAHHTNEHLQTVLNWSEAQRTAASAAARQLQQDLNAAIKAGKKYFRIPPGDYLEWIPAGHHRGHRAVLVVEGAENMEIDARGATFWATGLGSGMTVVFSSCRNCRVLGLTADMIHSPFAQGVVQEIIPDGEGQGRDTLLLEPERDGFFPVEHWAAAGGVGRTWLMHSDGRVSGYVGASPQRELTASGQWAWTCPSAIRYQHGIKPGDRLSVGVWTGGGVPIINCGGMEFDDLTVFSAGSFVVWEMGVRCPGGNVYRRMKITSRPNSLRIGVGAKDGFHSYNQRQGPTLIECEIARTHDDGINIHGFINVVVKKLSDNRYILASVCGRDYDVGSELFLNQAPTMRALGSAKVQQWEEFDRTEGQALYATMQQAYRERYKTNMRDVINPEFCIVSFDQPVELDVLDTATSHDYCGRGTLIDGLYMHDGCNRGMLSPGTGAVVQNSRFENITFGGIGLTTSPNRYLEGGWMQDVKILNNHLENCGEQVFGGWFGDGVLWQMLGAISVIPALPPHFETAFLHLTAEKVFHNIEIRGNRIRNTRGLPILLSNTIAAKVSDNIIERPFQASPEELRYLDLTREGVIKPEFTPPVPDNLIPLLKQPFYGILIIASESVQVKGNRISAAPTAFKGLVGIGPWCRDIAIV